MTFIAPMQTPALGLDGLSACRRCLGCVVYLAVLTQVMSLLLLTRVWAQDLLVEVFTAEMPGGVPEASEVQATLAATQAHDLNLPLDDINIKVRAAPRHFQHSQQLCAQFAVGAPA